MSKELELRHQGVFHPLLSDLVAQERTERRCRGTLLLWFRLQHYDGTDDLRFFCMKDRDAH